MFAIYTPDPCPVGAVRATVVQTDEKVMAAGDVDGRTQRLVEPGRIFREHEVEASSLRLEALLPPEGCAKRAEAIGDECAIEAQGCGGRESRDCVVGVVKASKRQLDSGVAHVHGDAVESVELDI